MSQTKKLRRNLKDSKYKSRLVRKLINRLLRSGKKTISLKIVHQLFQNIKETKTKIHPVILFIRAVKRASPEYELKSKRVGGAVNQVPVKLIVRRARSLSLRWILSEVKSKNSKKSLVQRLSHRIRETAAGSGDVIKKREELDRAVLSHKVVS